MKTVKNIASSACEILFWTIDGVTGKWALRRNVWNPAPIDRCPMIACRQEDSDSW